MVPSRENELRLTSLRPIAGLAAAALLGSLHAACTSTGSRATPDPKPPNVVLVMADDLGWGDTGYNGHPLLSTPNLDAMSAAGVRFDRFYAGAPVCSPTRGSCLTGRHPYRYGVTGANQGHLRAEETSLAEVLHEAGYATGHFGKWHLGTMTADYSGKGAGRRPEENHCTPGMAGFDEWFSTEFAVATWDPYAPENSHRHNRPWDPRALYWENGRNVTEPLEGCDSRLIMDRAVAFIEGSVERDAPFFCVVWFHAPHVPVVGGPEFLERYPDPPEGERHYYATVTALDHQVGRLRGALRELGVADDTMLWFTSDNGPEGNPGPRDRSWGSTGPFRGRKRSLYEGGVRVPGLLEWPAALPEACVVAAPCSTSDYFPTVLSAVGIPLPEGRALDGIDVLPLITGERDERGAPIAFRHGPQAALSGDRFKLVRNDRLDRHRSDTGVVPVEEVELYDLVNDPGETRNVASEHPRVTAELRERLERWTASLESD